MKTNDPGQPGKNAAKAGSSKRFVAALLAALLVPAVPASERGVVPTRAVEPTCVIERLGAGPADYRVECRDAGGQPAHAVVTATCPAAAPREASVQRCAELVELTIDF